MELNNVLLTNIRLIPTAARVVVQFHGVDLKHTGFCYGDRTTIAVAAPATPPETQGFNCE